MMSRIEFNGLTVSAQTLNALNSNAFGEDGINPLGGGAAKNVKVDTTAFSYIITAPRFMTEISGTGENLVFDQDNRPIGGTISNIYSSTSQTLTGSPTTTRTVSLTELAVDASVFSSGNLGDVVLADDNDVSLAFTPFGPFTQSSILLSGAGDDVIDVRADINAAPFNSGGIGLDTGDGDDLIRISANFPTNVGARYTTGTGSDTIEISVDEFALTKTPQDQRNEVSLQTITDFDVANDQIDLADFISVPNVRTDRWIWNLRDEESGVALEALNVGPSLFPTTVGARILLEGVTASQLSFTEDGFLRGIDESVAAAAPVFGTEGADVLFGNPDANIINGLGGDDSIITFENDDVLLGGEGNDSLDGGSGNDQLFGENGNDQIFAGGGDDAVFGGFGDDLLVGDADGTTGVDGLFGEDGNDVAYGGFGNDFISGGNGNDVLFGETGNDEILGGEGSDIIIGGTDNDQLFGENGDDVIDGGQGTDIIFGGFGNDLIFGGDGNGAAGDGLFGEAGDDVIRGGSGNDFILGGLGNDVISGGTGADIVRLESASGFDFWQDFENGVDRIDASFIVGGRDQVVIAATLDGTGTYIGFTETQLILEGVDFNLIDHEDFIFDEVDAA